MSVLSIEPTKPAESVDSGAPQRADRRLDIITFALMTLLIISAVAVLYIAKAIFLPIVLAFIIGTMLSPAAGYLERLGIPRAVSAVLTVTATCLVIGAMVGLISSPLLEWSSRLPELGALLKTRLAMLDRPLALWNELGMFSSDTSATLQFPKIDWVQPMVEFLSPTFTEFLLFAATLVLFVASWKDLRRTLVMTFADRDWRLRILKMLNAIEASLGGYLLTVTIINLGVGVVTGAVCAAAGMPNPAGLGALAAVLNYFPIIGPIAMFAILVLVGIVSFPTLGVALIAPVAYACVIFMEGHFITPTIVGRRLSLNALAVFLALAFWTWLWGPMGGFLSSPLLIVALVLKEHLLPDEGPHLPDE